MSFDLENPELVRWMDGDINCWAVTPQYKCELILDYAKRFGLTVFIETGTWHGDTVEYVRQHFSQVHTVELSPALVEQCKERFSAAPNVQVHLGDSGEVLKSLLVDLPKIPTLFWLDAHPSGGDTVGEGSPLERELTAILESGAEGVILIDDLQDCWTHGWADVARGVIARHGGWQEEETKHGIMRIVRAS